MRRYSSSERRQRGPAGPEPITYIGAAIPVAVAVRQRVVDDGGAGMPRKAETDTIVPVVAAGECPL